MCHLHLYFQARISDEANLPPDPRLPNTQRNLYMCAGMSLLDAMLEGGEPGCTGQAGGPTGKILFAGINSTLCLQSTKPEASFDACSLHRGVIFICKYIQKLLA